MLSLAIMKRKAILLQPCIHERHACRRARVSDAELEKELDYARHNRKILVENTLGEYDQEAHFKEMEMEC